MLSVVMPAHNERALLESSVRDVADGLRARGRPFEILVVENGSVDDTLSRARRLASETPELRVESHARADYGRALRTGLLAATGDVVVTFDVDYYDLAFLDDAVELIERAARPVDVVIASKRAAGARDERPLLRRLVTATFSVLLRIGFGLRVSDTHGMKALQRARVEPLARRCRFGGDLFDTELVLRAERAGLDVAELPVTVQERRPSRTPIWRRVPRTLVGLVRLRIALWREGRS
ncbi:MAG TPA: glycosyltransferase family 2 protein [Acidimicrobiia bacterium]